MSDILNILVQADLESKSVKDIKSKLDAIQNQYRTMKIGIELDDGNLKGELKEYQKLMNNIDKSKGLEKTTDQMKEQQKEMEKLQKQLKDLQKTSTKVGKNGTITVKNQTGNSYKNKTETSKNGQLDSVEVKKNVEKLENLKKDLNKKIRGFAKGGAIDSSELDSFAKTFKDLSVDSENLTDKLEKVDRNLEKLTDKEKAINKAKKKQLELQEKIDNVREKGNAPTRSVDSLEKKVKALKDFQQAEEKASKKGGTANYLQLVDKRIEEVSSSWKELDAKQSQHAKKNDAQKALRQQADALDQVGMNTQKVRQHIGRLSIKSKDLDGDIKNVKQSFADMFKQTDKFKTVEDKMRKMQGSYKGAKGLGKANNIEQMDKEMANIMQFINKQRKEGTELSKKDLDILEKEVNSLKDASDQFKAIEKKEEDRLSNAKQLEKKLEDLRHAYKKSLSDGGNRSKMKESIAEVTQQIEKLRKTSDNTWKEQSEDIDGQIRKLKRLKDEYGDTEKERKRQANLGSKIQGQRFNANEVVDDNDFSRTQNNVKKEAMNYIKQQQGLENVRDEMVQVKRASKDLKNEVWEVTYAVDRGGREYEEYVMRMDRASGAMYDAGQNMRRNRAQDLNVFQQLSIAMRRVPVWMTAMTAFYGVIRGVQQGVQSLYEIDKAMTSLAKVTEATTTELEDFRYEASQIGQELGVITADVIKATAEFSKLGYSLEEASKLGENSILYGNVGDMGVEEAQKFIVSAVKGFGVEIDKGGKNVENLVDIFNEVGNNFAISSAGIGEALTRSSAVLSEAGNTVEEAVGLVTAANTTIQNPRKVGTAMKTISMRLRGMGENGKRLTGLVPELEGMFNDMGLTMKDNEDTFKSTYDLMGELSSVWGELSDLEQAQIVEAVGGKEQGAIVSAMINNWTDAVGAYEHGLNSAGSAQEEFSKYMESMEYKVGRLKNSMEQFWLHVLDDDAMKSIIDGLNSIVQGATSLVDTLGALPMVMQSLFAVLLLMSKSIRNKVFLTGGATAFTTQLTSMSAIMSTIGSKAKWAGVMIRRGLLWMGGVGLATAGFSKLLDIIFKVTNARKLAREEAEKDYEQNQKFLDNMNDVNISAFDNLREQMETGDMDNEQMNEYLQMREDLISKAPELVDYYDQHDKAVLKSTESIKKLVKAKKEENAEFSKNNADELVDEKSSLGWKDFMNPFQIGVPDDEYTKLEKHLKGISDLEKDMRSGQGFKVLEEFMSKEAVNKLGENTQAYEDHIDNMYTKIEEMVSDGVIDKNFLNENSQMMSAISRGELDLARNLLKSNVKRFENQKEDIKKEIDESKGEFDKEFEFLEEHLQAQQQSVVDSMNISATSNEFKFLESFREAFKDEMDKFDDTAEATKNFDNFAEDILESFENKQVDISSIVKDGSSQKAIDEMKKVRDSFDDGSESAIVLNRMISDMKNELNELGQQADQFDLGSFKEAFNEDFDSYLSSIGELSEAYENLSDGKKMSLSQIYKLLKEYPELAKHLKREGNILTFNAEAVKKLADIKEKEFKNSMRMKKEEAEAEQKKTKLAIKGILAHVKATDFLNEARKKSFDLAIMDARSNFFAQQDPIAMTNPAYRMQLDKTWADIESKMKKGYEKYSSLQDSIKEIDALLSIDLSGMTGNKISGGYYEDEEKMVYITDEFKKALREVNEELREMNEIKTDAPKHSKEYRDAIRDEIKLLKEKKDLVEDEQSSLQKQIDSGYIQPKGIVGEDELKGGSGGSGGFNVLSAREYMTKDLRNITPMTANQADQWISAKAPSGSTMLGQGRTFVEAGEKFGVDPMYLIAHAAHETAWGTSNINRSKNNFYGINAVDSSPYASADKWNNIEDGITGGAEWISKHYINDPEWNQNTLDKMRNAGDGWHRYATDPLWDDKIAAIMDSSSSVFGRSVGGGSGSSGGGSSSMSADVAREWMSDPFYISSGLGDGRGHNGLDITIPGEADNGYPIRAIMDGTVARSGYQPNKGGNWMVLAHDDGSETKYMHMKKPTPLELGQRVSAGDNIGQIGTTGGSSGSHLHFERWVNGQVTDPTSWLQGLASGASGGGISTSTLLKKGSRGSLVKQLQSALGITADGIFGSGTQRAVRNYQSSNGLTVDGIAGKQTLSRLGLLDIGGQVLPDGVSVREKRAREEHESHNMGHRDTSNANEDRFGTQGSTSLLRKGSRSNAVKELQNLLGVSVDGIFGSGTESAVRKFQRDAGIGVDGIVGSNTWSALRSGGSSGNSSSSSLLKRGARGSSVKEAQRLLGISADGIFGKNTESAVRSFQQSNGLGVDGIIGKNTLSALRGGSSGGSGGSGSLLKKGARGSQVKELQKLLGVAVDGIFGSQTQSAVRKFQQQNGLSVDGIVGGNTWSALRGGSSGSGGSGGSGKGNLTPEEQKAIDDAKAEVDELEGLSDEAKRKIQDLYMAITEDRIGQFEDEKKAFEDNLARTDFYINREKEATIEWRALNKEKLGFLEKQKAIHVEEKAFIRDQINNNKNLSDSQIQQLREQYKQKQIEFYDIAESIEAVEKGIRNSGLQEAIEEVNNAYDELSDKMSDIDRQISMTDTEENEEKHISLLQEKLELQKEQQSQIDTNITRLERELKWVKKYPDLLQENKDAIAEWQEKQKDLNVDIHNTNEQIKDIYSTLADEVVDKFKDMYKKRKELALEALEDEREAEQERHDDKLEHLDEEMEKYNEVIQKQLDSIDKAESERDFDRQLGKLQEEKQEIQDQINKLSMDDSLEAKAQVKELKEQLENKEEEIGEFKHDRSIELQRESLQESLTSKQEQIKSEREEENQRYEKYQEDLNNRKEETNEYWDNMLQNERFFERLKEDIMKGDMRDSIMAMQRFTAMMYGNKETFGENASYNVMDSNKDLLETLLSLSTSSYSVIGGLGGYGSDSNTFDIDNMMEEVNKYKRENSEEVNTDEVRDILDRFIHPRYRGSGSGKSSNAMDEIDKHILPEYRDKLGRPSNLDKLYGSLGGKRMPPINGGVSNELTVESIREKIAEMLSRKSRLRDLLPKMPKFKDKYFPTPIEPKGNNKLRDIKVEVNIDTINGDEEGANTVISNLNESLRRRGL